MKPQMRYKIGYKLEEVERDYDDRGINTKRVNWHLSSP
jgi:hypothetical protein